MTTRKAIIVPEGKVFDDETVRARLEALGFSSCGSGEYVRPALPRRGALPEQKGVNIKMRLKPDTGGQERVYTLASQDTGNELVYAPETFKAEDVVKKVREWLERI